MQQEEKIKLLDYFSNLLKSNDLNDYIFMSFVFTIVLLCSHYFFRFVNYSYKINHYEALPMKILSIIYFVVILIPVIILANKYYEILEIVSVFYALPGIGASFIIFIFHVSTYMSEWRLKQEKVNNPFYLYFVIAYYFFYGIFYFLGLFDHSSIFFYFYTAFIIPFQTMLLISIGYTFLMFILFSENTLLA